MKRSKQNAEHYTWGTNCLGWHLLKSDSLSVIEEMMPPGTSEKLHFHSRAQQLFYILKGKATFELNGETVIVNASESFHIPPGAKHCIRNQNQEELKFLVISEPKSHGDRTDV